MQLTAVISPALTTGTYDLFIGDLMNSSTVKCSVTVDLSHCAAVEGPLVAHGQGIFNCIAPFNMEAKCFTLTYTYQLTLKQKTGNLK